MLQEIITQRFQVKPNKKYVLEIYNHLTGNDGQLKDEYGNTVTTAVWNMEPYNYLYNSKHIDFWYRSWYAAPECVQKYMTKYRNYAIKNKIEMYDKSTYKTELNCW